jgi:CheY-like chemotaxis protein
VVDDEPMVGKAIRRTLEPEHEVRVVGTGEAALEEIRSGARYDVIICDLLMPGVTGMEVHAALVQRDPQLAARMVFLTGGAFTEVAQAFLDRVPNPRLSKPFVPAELRALVRATMG